MGAGGGAVSAGNKPAVFTVSGAEGVGSTVRMNWNEPIVITTTGNVSITLDGTPVVSGSTVGKKPGTDVYYTVVISGTAGTITFGKRKQISYLYLRNLGSSVITCDITGMELTYLNLINLGSSVIRGDISGMKLTYLYLNNLGSSVIRGDISGMELRVLYLNNLGSSLAYGTNLLNITSALGIQLCGNTVFATAAEYRQLFIDTAACVSAGKWTASTKVFTISGGDNPGWSNVSAYYATIIGGDVTVKVPLAWESGDDPFPSETLNP